VSFHTQLLPQHLNKAEVENKPKIPKKQRRKIMINQKKSYEQPKLTVYGEVEVLTQGFGLGLFTDKDFPLSTPKDDLTFS
jgi:hypothetical protein